MQKVSWFKFLIPNWYGKICSLSSFVHFLLPWKIYANLINLNQFKCIRQVLQDSLCKLVPKFKKVQCWQFRILFSPPTMQDWFCDSQDITIYLRYMWKGITYFSSFRPCSNFCSEIDNTCRNQDCAIFCFECVDVFGNLGELSFTAQFLFSSACNLKTSIHTEYILMLPIT